MKYLIYLILFVSLSSCMKGESGRTWADVTKKGNVWHVDRMVVTRILYSSDKVEGQEEFFDVGDFTFLGEDNEDDDCALKFDGEVKLSPFYNYFYGPFELPLYFTSTQMYTEPDGVGVTCQYIISYLSKDKLNMYVQRELSPYYIGQYEFNFYFECSRK
ncbi:MAG: hypothetical protein V4622_01680 [Bacteroidota bacterium]